MSPRSDTSQSSPGGNADNLVRSVHFKSTERIEPSNEGNRDAALQSTGSVDPPPLRSPRGFGQTKNNHEGEEPASIFTGKKMPTDDLFDVAPLLSSTVQDKSSKSADLHRQRGNITAFGSCWTASVPYCPMHDGPRHPQQPDHGQKNQASREGVAMQRTRRNAIQTPEHVASELNVDGKQAYISHEESWRLLGENKRLQEGNAQLQRQLERERRSAELRAKSEAELESMYAITEDIYTAQEEICTRLQEKCTELEGKVVDQEQLHKSMEETVELCKALYGSDNSVAEARERVIRTLKREVTNLTEQRQREENITLTCKREVQELSEQNVSLKHEINAQKLEHETLHDKLNSLTAEELQELLRERYDAIRAAMDLNDEDWQHKDSWRKLYEDKSTMYDTLQQHHHHLEQEARNLDSETRELRKQLSTYKCGDSFELNSEGWQREDSWKRLYEDKSAKCDALQQHQHHIKQEVKDMQILRQRVPRLQVKNKSLKSKYKLIKQHHRRREQDFEQLDDENQQISQRIFAIQDENKCIKVNYRSLQQHQRQIEQNNMTLCDETKRLHQQISILQDESKTMNTKCELLQQIQHRHEEEKKTLDDEIETLRHEISTIRDKNECINADYRSLQQVQIRLEQENHTLDDKTQELRQQLSTLQDDSKTLKADYKRSKDRIKRKEEDSQSTEASCHKHCRESKCTIDALDEELYHTKPEYHHVIQRLNKEPGGMRKTNARLSARFEGPTIEECHETTETLDDEQRFPYWHSDTSSSNSSRSSSISSRLSSVSSRPPRQDWETAEDIFKREAMQANFGEEQQKRRHEEDALEEFIEQARRRKMDKHYPPQQLGYDELARQSVRSRWDVDGWLDGSVDVGEKEEYERLWAEYYR